MADAFIELEAQERAKELSHAEWLGLLVDREVVTRDSKRFRTRLKAARIVIGDEEKLVRENESVYIFATQWHRPENPGKVPLEIIEVQIGTFLGEDDIIRTDDVYNRSAEETK